MGKMKDVAIKQQEDQELDVLMEEAHYHNTINAFVDLIDKHGWPKVVGDVREKLLLKDWWSPC